MGRTVVAFTAAAIFAASTACGLTADEGPAVLVFTKTTGFRHDSIPAGVAALRELGAAAGIKVVHTEEAAAFTLDGLRQYDAVVFLNTTGDVLDAGQQRAFEAYIGIGRGFLGVHSATDTEYDWPFYGELVGAYLAQHPAVQPATVRPANGASWEHTDEWYDFRTNPRPNVEVLLTVDESTYREGRMGADHPIAWRHPYAGGRAYYVGLGHTTESYGVPQFRSLLQEGLRYVAGS